MSAPVRAVGISADLVCGVVSTMVTAGYASLCGLIDGRRGRRELLGMFPAPTEDVVAASILDSLEKISFVTTTCGPVAWLGPEPADLLTRLVALRDGPARTMLVIPATADCPVYVFAVPGEAMGLPAVLKGWGGSAGAGLSLRHAAMSCLFEAAERCSQMRTGGEEVEFAPFDAVANVAVHPDALLLDGGAANARAAPGGTPIRPLDRGEPIAWVPAVDLLTGDKRLLPADYCYRSPDRSGPGWTCPADSTGCAAGTSLPDIAFRGFLEAVERDAVAIWWFNRIRRPGCVITGAGTDAVIAWQTSRGRQCHLLDLTTDLGVPVRVAVSHDESGRRIAVGFGAHFDADIASLRAVLEMMQFQLMVEMSTGFRDRGHLDAASPSTQAALQWFDEVSIESEPYLLPDPTALPIARPMPPEGSDAALDRCGEIAREHRLDLLFVEMTRSWIGLPAGRVVVPGLRSMKRRTGGGRLYDVPVTLGWLKAPHVAAQLNPREIVF